jgi:miniconductance mechanosensitive channel
MNHLLYDFFTELGLSEVYAAAANKGVLLLVALLAAWIVDLISKKVLLSVITKIVRRTSTTWDDILVDQGVFTRLAHIVPALVLYLAVPLIFSSVDHFSALLQRSILAYMIGVVLLVLNSLISAANAIYRTFEISKSRPIKGYLQVLRIFISIIGIVVIITTILNKSALGLLSGIGALSAVIILVFRDSILGLAASVQLSGNDMVRIGDWITVPSYGADGDVVDITLQTVTVQNFDKTIVTVPIYSLVSSSFKNWRGMSESGGRRIKRSLSIDMNSVGFCTPEMIEQFRKIDILGDYIDRKQQEIDEDNRSRKANTSEMINGRRMTNLGIFRAYIGAYLHRHPLIHDDMTFLVRQLQPTDKGVPLEIYVFSRDQVWAHYEAIQADIFDHLLASISFFGLAVYQSPSSLDLRTALYRLTPAEK